jgi:hypothetical protein
MAVLIESGVSAVDMATAVQASDLATNMWQNERPPSLTNGSVTSQTLQCLLYFSLECKEADKASRGHVTPHLCEHCVVEINVVLCSCCRICLWHCREGNEGGSTPFLVTCIIYSNVWIFYCVNRCEDTSLNGLIRHLRKVAAFLGIGSSTSDLFVRSIGTVLKE